MHSKRKPALKRNFSFARTWLVAVATVITLLLGVFGGSPAAATSSVPIWAGTYNSGTLSEFVATSWNNVPKAPAVVSAPAFEGPHAGVYVIPAGGARSESVPKLRNLREGDSMYFGWSTRLGSGFPLNISNWQVITQWKNNGIGSPPLELKIANGYFMLDGGYGWPGNTTSVRSRLASHMIGAAHANVWDRWIAHIKFSSVASIGSVDLWRNGIKVFTGLHMPGGTLYPRMTSYLKLGYYRDKAIRTQGTVYQDDWKVGPTFASVH